MAIDIKRIIADSIYVFLTVILCIGNSNGQYNKILAVLIIAFGIIGIFRCKHNWYLLIIFMCITYSNYSICMAEYLFPVNSFFTTYKQDSIAVDGIRILAIFSLLMILLFPHAVGSTKENKRSLIINNKSNVFICIVLIVILIFIWIYGFTRPDIEGQRGSPSTVYEYSIILVIMGFYYSGNNKLLQLSFIGLIIIYALQNFVFGGRITGIQLLICAVLCIAIDHLSLKWVIPVGIIFFILMAAVGQFRASFELSGNAINSVIQSLANGKLTLDTAYSSYHTSMTFLLFEQQNDWGERINLFFNWVLSIFLGGSVVDSNLGIITRQSYVHYYGGVLPYYFHFYLGIPGVILISLYLSGLLKNTVKASVSESGYVRCLAVYITSTTFRWYLYSPSQIFRGVLIMTVVYVLLFYTDSFLKKRLFLSMHKSIKNI